LPTLCAGLPDAQVENLGLPQLILVTGQAGDVVVERIVADANCPNAGSCNCSCVICKNPMIVAHCYQHGRGCHEGCSKE
jgi:hypothetical protein